MGLLKQKQLSSSAEVVYKHLILSATNAIEPIVWRMALDKIGTASFEVKPIKNKEHHKLVLKPKKGTAELIALFETKDDALTALVQASDALQRTEKSGGSVTKARGATIQKSEDQELLPSSQQSSKKWLYLLFGFLLVVGLYAYMATQIPERVTDFGSDAVPSSQASTQGAGGGNAKTGVPLSADDFLSGL